jgi:hypothetical protein
MTIRAKKAWTEAQLGLIFLHIVGKGESKSSGRKAL